jgi:hypothetical protein
MEESGALLRLFPVPFRLLDENAQFKKWQWIEADIEKARDDHRPESRKIRLDNLQCVGEPLPTADDWAARYRYLDKINLFGDFSALEQARLSNGTSLGLIPLAMPVSLEIVRSREPTWSKEEIDKLTQHERQFNLFTTPTDTPPSILEKIPYDFYYRYGEQKHKIVDWEIGALYRNLVRSHGLSWERPFREKLAGQLPAANLHLLLGTVHRFPDQWLIVSLIYPPKRRQRSLF